MTQSYGEPPTWTPGRPHLGLAKLLVAWLLVTASSFHGGLGGPQTQPFLLYPSRLPFPDEPIVGAESVNRLLLGWRRLLNEAA